MNRRHFMMGSAGVLGAASATFGNPADTVRVATIGIGGRGKDHIGGMSRFQDVEIAALSDIDDAHLEVAVGEVVKRGKKAPAAHKDFRRILDDKTIDAVTIATPNHWHTLMAIMACQAGKDVYVEKPCSHNMFEAKQIVAAARKYNRMVQQGSQIRSAVGVQQGIQQIRDGLIGDVYLARGLCYKWRDTIGREKPGPVPPGVDFDLWLGPAAMRPFQSNRFHYNWHWFWDTGNGDLGNQGIHQVDTARWSLGVKYPTKVSAIGGKFMFDDDQETPNTLNCAYEFNDNGKLKMMEFEVRHWMSHGEATVHERGHNSIGSLAYGSKGYMAIDSYTSYKTWLGKEQAPGPAANQGGDHYRNFIEAVKSRKRESLNSEIEDAALSTVLVHLANISYRVGRTLQFDAATYTVKNDPEATAMFTRDYRKPYVVPENV
jgi:predicted dehydrogenase